MACVRYFLIVSVSNVLSCILLEFFWWHFLVPNEILTNFERCVALCFALRGRDAQKYHPITAGITAAGCPDAGDRGGARRRRRQRRGAAAQGDIFYKCALFVHNFAGTVFLEKEFWKLSPDLFPISFPLWVLKVSSKCLFGVFNFSQKTNENKSTWGIIVLKSNFFVRFLGELRIPKSPFWN